MAQLSNLAGSKNCVILLKLFIQKPDLEMYQSEITNEVKMSPNTTKKWLDFLVKNGLLNETKKGVLVLYSLSRGNPVVKQFKIFVSVMDLYEVFQAYSTENLEIYLFGSVARGEDNENSDVDLLILGQIDTNMQANIKKAIMNKMGKEVNLVVYTKMEYSDLYRNNKSFYDSIDKDKIRIR